jgi:hypothetical protein
MSPYATVAPAVPGQQEQTREETNPSAFDDAIVSLFKTPDVMSAPILALDAAFEEEFAIDPGAQAAPVTAAAAPLFDSTRVGTLLTPEQLHKDENGNSPILDIELQPAVYFNTQPPSIYQTGYNVNEEASPFGTITRVSLSPDDVLVVSLAVLSDQKTDSIDTHTMSPLQKPGDGEPAPVQYKATVRVGDLPFNEAGEISLRLAAPFTEDELAGIKDGSISLTVAVFERQADGSLVAKSFPGALTSEEPVSVDAGSQPAIAFVQQAGAENAPNAVFEKQEPPKQPTTPFFIPPITAPQPQLPPPRQFNSTGEGSGQPGGSGPSASGLGSGSGGLSFGGGDSMASGAFGRRLKTKPIPLTMYSLDLSPFFDEFKSILDLEGKSGAVDELDEIIEIKMDAVVGDGNFLSFSLDNISAADVEYWVVFVKDDQVMIQGPFIYHRDGDNPSFGVPPEYQNGKIYVIVNDHGNKDGDTIIIPERHETPGKQPAQAPRVMARPHLYSEVEQPATSKDETTAAESAPAGNSSAALIMAAPAALVVARDSIEKRLERARAWLRNRRPPSAPSAPKTEPEPKKAPASLDDTIPFQPLFDVAHFGQLVAKKNDADILSKRPWVYVPKAATEKELVWEVWGRYRTLDAVSQAPHMEVFLTAANEKYAPALEKIYRNMDRVKIRRPGDYDTSAKMRSLFDNEKLTGQIQFLIRQGAAVDQNFLESIYELSKLDGFIDRINVLLVVGTGLQGEAGRLQRLDDLMSEKVWRLFRSQA